MSNPPGPRAGDAAAPDPDRPAPFAPGEVVGGKYVLERVLGVGGVGMVLAARHVELDEVVAIKFLHHEMRQRPDVVRRFGVEARAAVRIKSEYAARVYDVGVSPSRGPYLVMEYLQGKDLADVLAERGPLPARRAVELVMQACEALAVAHSNGIVHRDVKPENLFLARRDDGSEVLKVLDFGISKGALSAGAAALAQTQELMGSPLYMSPEQVRAAGSVDHRTDVWSLGVVLYEMLAGEVPFPGETVTGVCARVLEAEPPPVARALEPLPEGLEAVVRRALEKDPAKRFQNVAEFAISLLAYGPGWARLSAERTNTIVRAAGHRVGVTLKVHSSAPPPSLLSGPSSRGALGDLGDLGMPPPPRGLAPFTQGAAGPSPVAGPPTDPEALRLLTNETRRTRRVVLVASTGALALAALAVALVLRPARAPAAAPAPGSAAATAPSAPAAASEVTLSLAATPPEAKLYLDDAPLGANPFKKKVPRDGLPHSVRAEAKGYATRSLALTFDSDKDIALGLDRAVAAAETARPLAPAPLWRAPTPSRRGGAATPPPSPPAAAPPAAPAAEPAPKPVEEVNLAKTKKPVRAIDSGNMW